MAQLFKFQAEVDRLVRAGRSVILQAPTGSGKTRAALFPFLDAWRDDDPAVLPRQCIYAVPLRTLANQFQTEYEGIVQSYRTAHGLRDQGTVTIQTGARPEDRKLTADLVFTTIDQVLSSFLTIPHSLSNRQANLNAGAVIGSYLVFDEFHLFPVDENGNGALATTLQMLKMLKSITPFVLMTATFSTTMLHQLCSEFDAEPVTLTPEEVAAIPSQQGKQRRYLYAAEELSATAVVHDFIDQQRTRAIVVCNTVERARALAEQLLEEPDLDGVHVELLHSRFYARDRAAKEYAIHREFGPDTTAREWGRAILVATQVVEVGLNISCEVLHTEVAPASAVVQRAGRCARFAGESGLVRVYDVPLNAAGLPNFAPYVDSQKPASSPDTTEYEGQSKLCERTLGVFRKLPQEGAVLSYHGELDLVNEVHAPFDEHLLRRLNDNRHELRNSFERVFETQDRSQARELIRDIDTRTVLVHANPTGTSLPNPYRYEGISAGKTSLLQWFTQAHEPALAMGLDWIVKIAVPQESRDAGNEGPEQRGRVSTEWLALHPSGRKEDIRAQLNDLAGAHLVAVHPTLVQYDARLGFQFTVGSPAPESPLAAARMREDVGGPIYRETYEQHIMGLYRLYRSSLRSRTAATRRRFEQTYGLPRGTLDQAIRVMFAVHDLGKLDRQWQAWAHAWQGKVSGLRGEALQIPPDYMAAHTDYDGTDRREWEAQQSVRPKRPPHASESARAARTLLDIVAGDCTPLYVALCTAIICHHSSTIRETHGPFTPAHGSRAALLAALETVGVRDAAVTTAASAIFQERFEAEAGLSEDIIKVQAEEEVLLYLFLVRVLRLADQGSQERPEVP
ncbi:MAG TPA: CRISPR-associated helicase Cas3' [Herpetosiphonaceae bacterium]|nr:CRISPR-associated helicase Cas3' [Herpetosiphonaceae bacterium]